MQKMLEKIKIKLDGSHDPELDANYRKLKRMAKDSALYAKTEPFHKKYKCRYKGRCIWHG